jgi:demethylmenaquinone methyltransferase/2-methoxy-6-polyprenyl-1,4-benzoquinol methylase
MRQMKTETNTKTPLADAIATPDGKRRYVRTLFSTIADRYDLITVLLSYGQDQRWKRRLVDLVSARTARPGGRALDLATGTGDIAFRLAASGWNVIGLDVTRRMIELAREKALALAAADGRRAPRFLVGDMLALPFPAGSFDVVTAGYGLRNVPDLRRAIDEIHRVLHDGGWAMSLDFNRPANSFVRAVYLAYLRAACSAGRSTATPTRIAISRRPSGAIQEPKASRGCSRRAGSSRWSTRPSSAAS